MDIPTVPLLIRPARLDELEPLLAMQQRSIRVLGSPFYPGEVLEAALAQMGTMDPRLICDGTFLVAELDGKLAGSAGWSLRTPNYMRLMQEALPALPGCCGVVRSVFVNPELTRQGIARRLMAAVEERLVEAGVDTAELMATFSGVPLYASLGYQAVSDHTVMLAGRMEFPVRRMMRSLVVHGAFTPHDGVVAAPYREAAAAG